MATAAACVVMVDNCRSSGREVERLGQRDSLPKALAGFPILVVFTQPVVGISKDDVAALQLSDTNDMQLGYLALLDCLKPGGELVVMDNSATAGSELTYTADLNRIDEAYLKAEILKSGFEFVSESDLLRNPDDDLQSSWWEDTETRPSGYQDRFAFRFRKP